MNDCNHTGARVYVRRALPDSTVHICVQCAACLELLKLPQHKYRPYLRLADVPSGQAIGDWTEREAAV